MYDLMNETEANATADMIFVKKITRPEFLRQQFYTKIRVNRNKTA